MRVRVLWTLTTNQIGERIWRVVTISKDISNRKIIEIPLNIYFLKEKKYDIPYVN